MTVLQLVIALALVFVIAFVILFSQIATVGRSAARSPHFCRETLMILRISKKEVFP